MRVLIVCSGNFPDPEMNFSIYQAFIYDQIKAISKYHSVDYDLFLIKGKGLSGYLSNFKKLKKRINRGSYDLVHSHFSLSGLLSILASRIPVVITFHGSDINKRILNIVSSVTSPFASRVIFVSEKMVRKAFVKTKQFDVIPCGIDFEMFYSQPMDICRQIEQLSQDSKYILFSSAFNIGVKNYSLAVSAIRLAGSNFNLVELKNRSREQVRNIINACDLLLLTSFTEGSPQIIKEAMACNCPIVATDVGDIREVIGDTEGCFITSFDPTDVAEKIKLALAFGRRTNGREKIKRLDNKIIAGKIVEVYKEVLKRKMKLRRREGAEK